MADKGKNRKQLRATDELVVIVILAILVFVIVISLDLLEAAESRMGPIREIGFLLFLIALSLAAFSWRRWSEAKRTIGDRERAQVRLMAARNDLEQKVEERDSELSQALQHLDREAEAHKRAELNLKANNERLDSLVLSNPGVAYVAKPTEDIPTTYISMNVVDQLGYERDDFLANPTFWADRVHPDDKDQVYKRLSELLHYGTCVQEYRFKAADGNYRWLRDELRMLRDPDGKPREIVGVWFDISDHKQLEEKLSGELSEVEKLYKEEIEELLHTERVLEESNARINSVFQSITDGLFMLDNEWRFTYVNENAEGFVRKKKEELLGREIWDVFPEAVDTAFYANFRRALAENRSIDFEEYYPPYKAWYEAHAYPSEKGLTVYFNEITERKLAEQALKRSEARLAESQRIAHMGTWEWNIETNDLHWTDEVYRIFGLEPGTIMPTYNAFLGFVHPEDREMVDRAVNDAVSLGKHYSIDHRIVLPDNTERTVQEQGQVTYDVQGAATRMIGTVLDITERKRAEQVLEESEVRFRKTFEEGPLGMAIIGLDYRFVDVNEGLCRITGYSADELKSKAFVEITHPDDMDKTVKLADRLRRGDIPSYSLDKRYVTKDGGAVWVSVTVSLVKDNDQNPLYFLSMISDISERKLNERKLEMRERQQMAIAQLGQSALAGIGLDKLIDQVPGIIRRSLGVGYCKVLELQPDGKVLLLKAGVGWRDGLVGKATVDTGTDSQAGYTLATDEPVVVEDLRDEERFSTPPLLADHDIVSGISVIIGKKEQPYGILGVHTTKKRAFTDDEAYFVQSIANILSDELERTRAEEAVQRHLERLGTLRAIDMAITASTDLKVTLDMFLDQLMSQLGVDAADILLFNPYMQVLEYGAGRGFKESGIKRTRLRLGEGHAGRAALERVTVSVPNLIEDSLSVSRRLSKNEAFVAHYSIPLIAKGRVKGVLEIFHRSELRPDPEWLDYLEALGGQAAIAIDNATLFADLQQSKDEIFHAYDETLEGWVKALDLRSRETEGHSIRVTDETVYLSHRMGVPESQMIHVRRGALLHDIGKIGVPDSILHKPGSLTEKEWKVMRRHPVYAYNMLSSIAYLRPAIDIPYCHHEKWDGSGYPRGLKGDQIPLPARIFAVIDVWDALISERVYRKALPVERALNYIRTNSGTHFDPAVVDAFMDMESEGRLVA